MLNFNFNFNFISFQTCGEAGEEATDRRLWWGHSVHAHPVSGIR
jgi:hypothetical protein